MYSTALAFQKLKIEKHNSLGLAVQNDTMKIQNSALISTDSLYIKDKFFSNAENVADFSQASLSFGLSNEKPASYALLNRNCYSAMSTVKRKVAPLYTVEITKVLSPQKFQFNSNYFLFKKPLLNDSYSQRELSTFRKSLCISVLMR